MLLNQRKKRLGIIFIGLLLLGIAIWWGGREIWRIPAFLPGTDFSESDLIELQEIFEESDDSSYAQFNLATVYYKQQNYEKASNTYRKLLNSGESDSDLTKRLHFNLGAAYYRMAESEQEKDLKAALDLLTGSLSQYRIIIDRERQKEATSGISVKDEDAHFNYTLVRKKLKIIRDQLTRKEREQAEKKSLYRILKELRENEERIAEQLGQIKATPLSKENLERRDSLMRQREQNLDQLQLIREKMLNAFNS